MSPKDSFWIGAKGGLLEKKHVKKMGQAVWLFLYFLRGQTGVNEAGEGIFQYGHPITLDQISSDFGGVPTRTIRKWCHRLRRAGYIRIEPHSNRGVTVWVAKGKNKTKKLRVATKLESQLGLESKKLASQNGREFGNSRPFSVKDSAQAIEATEVAGPIPKGFIPKTLSYYNKPAAAQTAAGVSFPFTELAKAKSVPQEKSPWEIDTKRRELLTQAEEIKRKYPTRKEATA